MNLHGSYDSSANLLPLEYKLCGEYFGDLSDAILHGHVLFENEFWFFTKLVVFNDFFRHNIIEKSVSLKIQGFVW